jgi:dipeptidyl aminopeptidase/acylaminoacyl peptidase
MRESVLSRNCRFSVSVLFVATLIQGLASAADKRAPELNDFFRFEDVGDLSLSPDGKMIAYTLTRPLHVGREPASPYFYSLGFPVRQDVWVVPVGGGSAMNITDGAADGAWFWDPIWSPDGAHLLMISTRNTDLPGLIEPWMWTRQSNSLRQLTSTPFDYLSGNNGHGVSRDLQWITNDEVLFVAPVDRQLTGSVASGAFWKAGQESSGKEPLSTVSVLNAGGSESLDKIDTQIMTVNIDTGRQRVIATTSGSGINGYLKMTYPSPDGKYVAYLKGVALRPVDPDRPLSEDNDSISPGSYEVEVVNIERGDASWQLRGLSSFSADYYTNIIWSPDGRQLVLRSFQGFVENSPQILKRCKIEDRTCQLLEPEFGWNLGGSDNWTSEESVVWSGKHNLLVRELDNKLNSYLNPNSAQVDWKWKRVDDHGNLASFGSPGSKLPRHLFDLTDGSGVVGISDGKIERIVNDGNAITNLAGTFSGKITGLERIDDARIIFTGDDSGGKPGLFELNVDSGTIVALPKPTPTAHLVGFDGRLQIALFRDNKEGARVWAGAATDINKVLILEKNTFVRDIEPFRTRTIPYLTSDGLPVLMDVLFPPGYEAGKPYPVVVKVYPGGRYFKPQSGGKDGTEEIEEASMESEQVFAAHGYVVMRPSMPNFLAVLTDNKQRREGRITDAYLELTKGVLPAVDKLIELGIADSDRIGLYGHSDGGYATLGLVTETNRFKAVIAQSARTDLLSYYGEFDPRERYTGGPEIKSQAQFIEMVDRTDGPPWKNLWGYLRNSPITYVDRVQTPVMIVQGDMDFGGIRQGEESYTALQRQNKRVEFARYWGEGHVFQSPENIYDLWQRQFAWFDEFLKPQASPPPAAVH